MSDMIPRRVSMTAAVSATLLAVVVALTGAALAQQAPPSKWPLAADTMQACATGEPARRIEACGAIIARPREPRPAVVVALRLRSAAFRASGDRVRALADLDRAVTLEPRGLAVRLDRGSLHFEMDEDERALADFDRAVEADRDSVAALVGRAAVLDRLGEERRALRDLDRAVEVGPKVSRAHANRAHLLLRLQLREAALVAAERAVAADPDDAWAYEVRGLAFQAHGDLVRARSDFDRVIELSGQRVPGLLLRAGVRLDMRDFAGAIDDYSRVLDLAPRTVPAFIGRARAHLLGGNAIGAIADADAAIAVSPRSAGALEVRGRVHAGRGAWAEAISDFDAAIGIDAQSSGAYLGRARVRLAQGDAVAAGVDLQRAAAIPAITAAEQETEAEASRLLTELGEREEGASSPVQGAILAQPAGAAGSPVVTAAEPPVWTTASTAVECRLSATWPDRGIVIFARSGLLGSDQELRIGISAESTAWISSDLGKAVPRLSLSPGGPPVRIEIGGRASVRVGGVKGPAVNIGPLELGELRSGLATAQAIVVALGDSETQFPAGDLWAWLAPFEACARALPREPVGRR